MIEHALARRHTLAVLPTGLGKSLCYQLPAQLMIRPHYRTMLARLPELKRATFLALTATATPEVQRDIAAALALPDIQRVIADFDRPNLHFETFHIDDRESKDELLLDLLSRNGGAAIVYASTRKEAATVHQLLESRGFNVGLYHAGLDAAKRSEAQRHFLQGDCRVIAATVAFGLGIDKPDVRRVIHYNVPGSLENYYQEAGRAGRDGERAVCTLLYSQSDVRIQRVLLENSCPEPQTMLQIYGLLLGAHPLAVAAGDLAQASRKQEIAGNAALQALYEQKLALITADGKYLVEKPEITRPKIEAHSLRERRRRAEDRLRKVIAYALDAQCRRAQILGYFGQKFSPPCGGCDVCASTTPSQPAPARTAQPPEPAVELIANSVSDRAARIILQTVADFGGRLGRTLIADVLAGSKRKRITELNLDQADHYGALRLHTQERALKWIDELITQRLLKTTAEEYPRLMITERGVEALNGKTLLALSGLAQTGAGPVIDKTTIDVVQSFGARAEAASAPTDPQQSLDRAGDWRLQVEIWRQGGPEPARKILMDLLRDSCEGERDDLITVISALKDLNVVEAGEELLILLGETTNGILINAISDALGHLGVEDAAGALIDLLDDQRQGARRIAARALGRLRARPALSKLERLATDDSAESVRIAAAAAVWRIKAEESD